MLGLPLNLVTAVVPFIVMDGVTLSPALICAHNHSSSGLIAASNASSYGSTSMMSVFPLSPSTRCLCGLSGWHAVDPLCFGVFEGRSLRFVIHSSICDLLQY